MRSDETPGADIVVRTCCWAMVSEASCTHAAWRCMGATPILSNWEGNAHTSDVRHHRAKCKHVRLVSFWLRTPGNPLTKQVLTTTKTPG